jgi:hypothetical protein
VLNIASAVCKCVLVVLLHSWQGRGGIRSEGFLGSSRPSKTDPHRLAEAPVLTTGLQRMESSPACVRDGGQVITPVGPGTGARSQRRGAISKWTFRRCRRVFGDNHLQRRLHMVFERRRGPAATSPMSEGDLNLPVDRYVQVILRLPAQNTGVSRRGTPLMAVNCAARVSSDTTNRLRHKAYSPVLRTTTRTPLPVALVKTVVAHG